LELSEPNYIKFGEGIDRPIIGAMFRVTDMLIRVETAALQKPLGQKSRQNFKLLTLQKIEERWAKCVN